MALTIYQGKQYLFVNLGGTADMISPLQLGRGFFYAQRSKDEKSSQTKEEIQ